MRPELCDERSNTRSPRDEPAMVVAEHFAPAAEDLVRGDDQAGAFVAAGDELKEQDSLRLRDVADFVDDEPRVAAQAGELGLESSAVVGLGVGRPIRPRWRTAPDHGLSGPDRQADRQVGPAGAGRAEGHHLLLGNDEVQGAQMREGVAFEAAGDPAG
jgi:hypothetical protein